MFPGESQRKQGRLSTLQFESEIKFTTIFSWRWVRSKTVFAITTQLQWTFESTKYYFRSTATPHMQRSLLASLTSLGSSSLFTDPLFSLTGLTIWLLKGGGVGVLVWVRIFFPISLEIEFFFLTYKGVRFFQHYTPCWKFFWVQVSPCKISFSLEISLQYSVFLKSSTPRLKIQMFGLLEIIEREWK